MGKYPKIMILPSCLLEKDITGRLRPADYDKSGGALFGQLRFDAAKLVAMSGTRFNCVGSSEQVDYLKNELPGNRHLSVYNPDRFPHNTSGNIVQARELVDDFTAATLLPNLYYAWRWREWTGIRCLPAEAILTAHYNWGYEKHREVFGSGSIARMLSDITMASASRINTGGDGTLTESEFEQFNWLIQELPTSDAVGPGRDKIPADLAKLFGSLYERRLRDELCGVSDIRHSNYKSFVPN